MSEIINLAILGPVSAGKSTLLNALCSNTFSDMKRKKTTMLPQIYNISYSGPYDEYDNILIKNRDSNDKILKLREYGEFNVEKDLITLHHIIKPISDFITLPDKNTTYSILDMPGLNCGGDDLYYDYIKKVSKNIDVYIVVFDINSGVNTSDEVQILKLVNDEIKKNNHGYLHVIMNKCDDISIDDNKNINLGDDELDELYTRSIETIKRHCKDIIDVSITPLCSSKLYIYRGVKNNISSLDEKQLDNIIKEERGKSELKKLNTKELKIKFISELIKEDPKSQSDDSDKIYDNWMNYTGYNMFISSINKIISNYSNIIFNHIHKDLLNFLNDEVIDENYNDKVNNIINETTKRINRLKDLDNKLIIPTNIEETINKINKKLNDRFITISNVQSLSIIDSIIEKYNTCKSYFVNLFSINKDNNNNYKNEVDTIYKHLQSKRDSILINSLQTEFNEEIYKELCETNKITNEILEKSLDNTFEKYYGKYKYIGEFIHSMKKNQYSIIYLTKMNFDEKLVNQILFDKYIEELSKGYYTNKNGDKSKMINNTYKNDLILNLSQTNIDLILLNTKIKVFNKIIDDVILNNKCIEIYEFISKNNLKCDHVNITFNKIISFINISSCKLHELYKCDNTKFNCHYNNSIFCKFYTYQLLNIYSKYNKNLDLSNTVINTLENLIQLYFYYSKSYYTNHFNNKIIKNYMFNNWYYKNINKYNNRYMNNLLFKTNTMLNGTVLPTVDQYTYRHNFDELIEQYFSEFDEIFDTIDKFITRLLENSNKKSVSESSSNSNSDSDSNSSSNSDIKDNNKIIKENEYDSDDSYDSDTVVCNKSLENNSNKTKNTTNNSDIPSLLKTIGLGKNRQKKILNAGSKILKEVVEKK